MRILAAIESLAAAACLLIGPAQAAVQHAVETAHPPAAAWQYYHTPAPSLENSDRLTPPAEQAHPFGHPSHIDPLFAQPKPSWAPQHLEKPLYERPSYTPPAYTKPSFGQDPVRKPVYERPLAILPNDNKPSNYVKKYQPPAYMKPTQAMPVYRDSAVNYVIKPEHAPAYHRPAYDPSGIRYTRPEYNKPVYTPQEYKPPRAVPPPYIAPPR